MGAGFAHQIRYRYPKSYDYYRHVHDTLGLKLGEVYDITERDKTILHCITQTLYGRDGVYVDYDAVMSCMEQINVRFAGKTVAMPQIGAGLAGGDWFKIEKIIEWAATDFQPVVYIL